jgi:MFS family permease
MFASRSRWFRLSLFGLIYFVQGVAMAYFRNFQKPYLDSLNISATVIGVLTTILLLPFVLKIFIGMLSDKVNLFGLGHRMPYMAVGLALAALAFAGAGLVLPESNFTLFAVLIVIGSFSVTLFDSTADGLAIDTTPRNEQGAVQGTMSGGRAVGFILLSVVFGLIAPRFGYRPVFLIIALSMVIPLIWVLQVREPKERPAGQAFQWGAFKALGQPRFLIFAAYAILYSVVSFGVDGLVTYFMSREFNAPEELIGTYGALRGVGAVVGVVAVSLLIDRLGRRQTAVGALIALSVGAALLGASSGIGMIMAAGTLWSIAWGFQETVFVVLAMDLSDKRIAASMFAIMMALSNLGTAIGEGVATSLTGGIGFRAVFWALAAANLIVVPILWGLFRVAPEIAVRATGEAE